MELTMLAFLKRVIPKQTRDRLRPQYQAFRRAIRSDAVIDRDWSLKLDVPHEQGTQFLEAALAGTVDVRIGGNHVNVLLCAQPKSAGLYLTQLLALCLDFKNHQIGFDRGGGPIYYPRLLAAKFAGTNTISHCHAAPTPVVLKMVRQLELRPIVLTRNLLDALVSRRDMLVRDGWAPEILSDSAVKSFLEADGECQIDVIIELFADQYINFCAGWDALRGHPNLEPIHITYEQMLEDEVGLVSRLGRLLGQPVSMEKIRGVSQEIREAGGINFNVGQQGRGRALMTGRQIETLRRKARILGCSDVGFLGFAVD
jgi:hypothetical protein